jgi:hypothetical protein
MIRSTLAKTTAAAALLAASAGCADLTRPDEISIIAEPAPNLKAPPVLEVSAADVVKKDGAMAPGKARPPKGGGKKAGG